MRITTKTKVEEVPTCGTVDPNTAMFARRKEIKRQMSGLKGELDALDEDIKPAVLEGEVFTDGEDELYIVSAETTTVDWKKMITSGILTPDQIAPYLKRTVSAQLRTRKVEKATPVDPSTKEGKALRDRISKTAGRLVS